MKSRPPGQFHHEPPLQSTTLLQIGQVSSSDEVSRLGLALDAFLRVSVSKISGFVSVSKVSGLETLNIAKKWFIKISIIQSFLFVAFAGKKQSKQVGQMPEI